MIHDWEIPYLFPILLGAFGIAYGVALILEIAILGSLALILLGLTCWGKVRIALTASTDPHGYQSRYYSSVNPVAWNAAVAALFVLGAVAIGLGISRLI